MIAQSHEGAAKRYLESYIKGFKPRFIIHYDALQEGKWFESLDVRLQNTKLVKMLEKGKNAPAIDALLEYDRPDIVLTYGGIPCLALERTEEVPTGHNVGQRFARIVRAAELRVPFVYFFPFVAQKHGNETQQREAENKTNQRYVNARLFKALERLEQIHHTLILPVNWPVDNRYELLRTKDKDNEIREIVSLLIDAALVNLPLNKVQEKPTILANKEKAKREKETRLASQPRYKEPPPTVRIVETNELIDHCSLREPMKKKLSLRKKSLVYEIGMKYVRSDPYTGMLLFYDYLIARTGPSLSQRSMNLVAMMPNISIDEWRAAASEKSKRKDIFLYTRFADVIVLAGGFSFGAAS